MKRLFQKIFSTKKRIHIEFCQKNLDRHLNEKMTHAFSELLRHPSIQYKEFECLSRCSTCTKTAFAIINGHYIEANNMNDLLQHIKSEMGSS